MARAALVALIVLLVAPSWASGRAGAGGVTVVSRELAVGARTVAVPRFDLVGFRWRGAGTVEFRARHADGGWSAWQAPDDTNPSWTGTADALQYRVHGRVSRLRGSFIWSPVEHETWRTLSIAGSPPIISRDDWGGNELFRRAAPRYAPAVRLVIVHHTATSNDYTPDQAAAIVRGIDVYHVRTNGWNDIGYNFLIDRFGRIYEGRYGGITRNVIGAHALGFNTGSVGIALIGNFMSAKPTTAAVQSLEKLIAWRLDLAHVDPVSTLTFVSGGSERWRAGAKVTVRAVSGHRDTGSTSCPGNYLYSQLNRIASVAEQTGLPKLYAPVVSGKIGGPVVFSGRLSSGLPWNITVAGPGGRRVASASGTGPAIAWTWNSAGFAPGRYAWTMSAGSSVLAAKGVVGGTALPPPPGPLVSELAVAPAVVSPNGDGYADTATISYTLSTRAAVTASVLDANGTAVETLFSGQEQSARAISFGFSPGDVPDGHYSLALAIYADDGRSETHSFAFTVDRILSAVTAAPPTIAPGAALAAGFTLAGEGQVTVSILAPDGSTVTSLFQGDLAAGTYSYAWNGLLGDATPAPVGNYQVVVSVVDPLGTVTQPAAFAVVAAPP